MGARVRFLLRSGNSGRHQIARYNRVGPPGNSGAARGNRVGFPGRPGYSGRPRAARDNRVTSQGNSGPPGAIALDSCVDRVILGDLGPPGVIALDSRETPGRPARSRYIPASPGNARAKFLTV